MAPALGRVYSGVLALALAVPQCQFKVSTYYVLTDGLPVLNFTDNLLNDSVSDSESDESPAPPAVPAKTGCTLWHWRNSSHNFKLLNGCSASPQRPRGHPASGTASSER